MTFLNIHDTMSSCYVVFLSRSILRMVWDLIPAICIDTYAAFCRTSEITGFRADGIYYHTVEQGGTGTFLP